VDELGTPAAGAEGEVVLLGEHDRETATGRIERHARAGDTAPDHQQVDLEPGVDLVELP
jgi:hypothetical protein